MVDYAFRSFKRQLILISHILVQLGSLWSRPEYRVLSDPLDFRCSNEKPKERSEWREPLKFVVKLGRGEFLAER